MKITKEYIIGVEDEDEFYGYNDEYLYKIESQAQGMHSTLQSIMGGYGNDDKSFRTYRKYANITPNQHKILEEMHEWVCEVLNDNNVDLDIG